MKRTLILTVAVLACALALCLAAQAAVNAAVDEARRLESLAVLAAEEGRGERAMELVTELARLWSERGPVMELLASHDALHEVGSAIAEAKICLECDSRDDFLRAMSTVDMGLGNLRDEEALSWGNLY